VRFVLFCLFFPIQQSIVSGFQHIPDSTKLTGLYVLGTPFDLDQTFPGHITATDLQQPHQIGLSQPFLPSYPTNIVTDPHVLLHLLFHFIAPIWTKISPYGFILCLFYDIMGLILVHFRRGYYVYLFLLRSP